MGVCRARGAIEDKRPNEGILLYCASVGVRCAARGVAVVALVGTSHARKVVIERRMATIALAEPASTKARTLDRLVVQPLPEAVAAARARGSCDLDTEQRANA